GEGFRLRIEINDRRGEDIKNPLDSRALGHRLLPLRHTQVRLDHRCDFIGVIGAEHRNVDVFGDRLRLGPECSQGKYPQQQGQREPHKDLVVMFADHFLAKTAPQRSAFLSWTRSRYSIATVNWETLFAT